MQDNNRKFVSLLIAICADKPYLPPFLIYKNNSNSLQDTWLKDWQPDKITYFAISPNKQTSYKLGLHWLLKVFHPYTKDKAGYKRYLLIMDNYSSHINMAFIEKYDKFYILLLILPPYTTYYLQPLNMVFFPPLSTYYTNRLNKLIFNSLRIIKILKRTFQNVFINTWEQIFIIKNILTNFKKAGIWPLDAISQIKTIIKPKVFKAPIPL